MQTPRKVLPKKTMELINLTLMELIYLINFVSHFKLVISVKLFSKYYCVCIIPHSIINGIVGSLC